MTKEDWNLVIKSCDMNGNGVIDFQEFISACLNRKALVNNTEIRKAFQIIDANKDGQVSKQDFEQVFNSHKKYGGKNMDGQLWEELLEEADKNGDGVISFDDFE
jgi:calcium-dependent protein kinase